MANPQLYIYTAGATRTVLQKGDIADIIIRISPEETPILALLARRKVQDPNPSKLHDVLQAVDLTNSNAYTAAAPLAASTARTSANNWVQELRKTITMTDWQNEVAQHGMGKEFDYQMMLRYLELAKDAEAIIVSDQAVQAATQANLNVGKMAGMGNIISTYTNTVANFNQANFDTLVRNAWLAGGNPSKVFLDATRMNTVSAWTTNATRYTTRVDQLDKEVQVYNVAVGPSQAFIPHRYMPSNIVGNGPVCIGLDLSRNIWEIVDFSGGIIRKELPDTGAGPQAMIRWALAPLCGAQESSYAFVV